MPHFEYGELQYFHQDYRFCSDKSEAGKELNGPLYNSLNMLALEGWEPVLFFEESSEESGDGPKTPVWVMRRER